MGFWDVAKDVAKDMGNDIKNLPNDIKELKSKYSSCSERELRDKFRSARGKEKIAIASIMKDKGYN